MVVISEPESSGTQTSSEGLVPPTPAEAAPVAVPGAPPPPPHKAVEAAHELERETPARPLTSESAPSTPLSASGESPELPEAMEEAAAEEEEPPFAQPLELIDETVADEDLKFDWYILKVQVNREDSIKEALWRRVKMNGLERYFKEIVVPPEDVIEFTKTGKKRTVKRKLYPGYILINLTV